MREIKDIKTEIYDILTDHGAISDFELSEKNGREIYNYCENKNINISILHNYNTRYSYEHFFDENKKLIDNLTTHEKFITKVCALDSSYSCCDCIEKQEWAISYGLTPIYRIDLLNIIALSSVDFVIPNKLEIFDFEYKLIEIINEKLSALFRYQALNIMENELTINKSTFKDFCR
ncbi:hypothetical protein [Halarcobacter sp.]|uniref:hypothetical protein n=1 Tax=Halarcobacter sp. TaxID=2321133 RepID=UPI0029F470DA|nr:hypothetical protein [Halarcobacter sp.]